MKEVLNSVIKFDLHIHSIASKYKENKSIVDQSTKENVKVLLDKLNQNNVALFSITDHNRFDPNIYVEISNILSSQDHPYHNVKGFLAGIEFDVVLEEGMAKCHIIAIFDTNNEVEKYNIISENIEVNKLTSKHEVYTKNNFEQILKDIGLNTILIASQRKDIHNQSGNHNSLSDSVHDVEQIIRVGYINALEYQKPRVEGILLNNLKEISLPITLFSGSDCHDWTCYPYHDKQNQNKDFYHSKAKILPTFKGLLMAITSPETRFNCSEYTNTCSISSIKIKDDEIPFVNGINAIIGENGSGKTTLLKAINGKTTEVYVKKIISINDIKVNSSIDTRKIKYVEQGEIIRKFNNELLFSKGDEEYFKKIDFTPFVEAYTNYSDNLKKSIELQIKKKEELNSLSNYKIVFEDGMNTKNYFVNITGNEGIENIKNPHENAFNSINVLLSKFDILLSDEYFMPYKDQLVRFLKELISIKEEIQKKMNEISYAVYIKNIMHSCIDNYLEKIKKQLSARDRDIIEYNKKREKVINAVISAIMSSQKKISWPAIPLIISGATKNLKQGFSFNRVAKYNETCMIDSFYSKMFIKEFNSLNKLQSINTSDLYLKAVRDCTSISDIDIKWAANLDKFIKEAIDTDEYIMDGTNQQIGNTLGEMSLSYYKFFTQDDRDWEVLIIDQPEDNISNNNICRKLIGYFDAIRDKRQIIFVTHNPLLVVNLDVDNVIFVKNNNGKLEIKNGCLEYENMNTNILDLIAQNMDGGKETIEKRLKVYGKSN
ncbi:MAG: ATP-binding cassette domain-containing protein [Candidatus Caldatribacteriota bacterium]